MVYGTEDYRHCRRREASADVVRHLVARPDCEVITRRLRLGDYHIAGRLLVERKRWPDPVASIVDGRLFRQASRLAGSPCHTVLLLEGSEEDIAEYAMTRELERGSSGNRVGDSWSFRTREACRSGSARNSSRSRFTLPQLRHCTRRTQVNARIAAGEIAHPSRPPVVPAHARSTATAAERFLSVVQV